MDVGSIKNSLNPLVSGRSASIDERKQQAAEGGNDEPVTTAVGGQGAASREQIE